MADNTPPSPPSQTFLCRLCGRSIQTVPEVFVTTLGVTHAACLERSAAVLTETERGRLIRFCWDHQVSRCATCSRSYRITEMGTDMTGRRYYLSPCCRVELVWSIRQHIADCAVIAKNDPQ